MSDTLRVVVVEPERDSYPEALRAILRKLAEDKAFPLNKGRITVTSDIVGNLEHDLVGDGITPETLVTIFDIEAQKTEETVNV